MHNLDSFYRLNFDKMNGSIMVALAFGGELADVGLMSRENFLLSIKTASILFNPCRVVSTLRNKVEVLVDCDRDTLLFSYSTPNMPYYRYRLSDEPFDFPANLLVPAVVFDRARGQVAMVGATNAQTIEMTKGSSIATFFSRTASKIWEKGENSGNRIIVESMRYSHQGIGAVVYDGVCPSCVCHKGSETCFTYDAQLSRMFNA